MRSCSSYNESSIDRLFLTTALSQQFSLSKALSSVSLWLTCVDSILSQSRQGWKFLHECIPKFAVVTWKRVTSEFFLFSRNQSFCRLLQGTLFAVWQINLSISRKSLQNENNFAKGSGKFYLNRYILYWKMFHHSEV